MVIDPHVETAKFIKVLKRSLPFHINLRDAKVVAEVARDFGGETAMNLLRCHFAFHDAVEEWRIVGDNYESAMRQLLYLGGDKFAWAEGDTLLIGDPMGALALNEITPQYEGQ